MKSLLIIICLLLSTITLASDSSHMPVKVQKTEAVIKKKVANKKLKDQLKKILKLTTHLHKSFFIYTPSKIKKIAKQLHNEIISIKDTSFSKIFKDLELAKFCLLLTKDNERKASNEAYALIAKNLAFQLVEKYELDNAYQTFYCPMVRKYWVQLKIEKAVVYNPYAPEMPNCGGIY
jgi:hypothetical protein